MPLVSKLPRSSCTIISAWLNCYKKLHENHKKCLHYFQIYNRISKCDADGSHLIWLVGQAVKTPPSHGGIRGSIPLRAVDYFRIAQPWKTEHIEDICSAFSCRALSESKPKAQLELSANGTWTLNECKAEPKHEFSETGTCRAEGTT